MPFAIASVSFVTSVHFGLCVDRNERTSYLVRTYAMLSLYLLFHYDFQTSNFFNFISDMGLKPGGLTLERINNNGNYEPDNCKWATYKEQNLNKRKWGTSGSSIKQKLIAVTSELAELRVVLND